MLGKLNISVALQDLLQAMETSGLISNLSVTLRLRTGAVTPVWEVLVVPVSSVPNFKTTVQATMPVQTLVVKDLLAVPNRALLFMVGGFPTTADKAPSVLVAQSAT